LCAQPLIGDEPFAVLLADDLIDGGCLKQMMDVYEDVGGGVIAVQSILPSETQQYGVVAIDTISKITNIIEKPSVAEAPSSLGVVGRYILPPQIFEALQHMQAGKGGEIQLTDAIAKLLKTQDIYALEFNGTRYDCGSKLGYLQATIAYALQHNEIAPAFRAYLATIL
jgi:UTP--glucose-1-phosphate uridylyltransferase